MWITYEALKLIEEDLSSLVKLFKMFCVFVVTNIMNRLSLNALQQYNPSLKLFKRLYILKRALVQRALLINAKI